MPKIRKDSKVVTLIRLSLEEGAIIKECIKRSGYNFIEVEKEIGFSSGSGGSGLSLCLNGKHRMYQSDLLVIYNFLNFTGIASRHS